MITVVEVPWDHADAAALRAGMAGEIGALYADRRADPDIAASMTGNDDKAVYTALALVDGTPAGHLALHRHGADLEIKRVYVTPAQRGRGVAGALLAAAEDHAREHGAARLILQTGDRQPDAVRLYQKAGYIPIPIFPPYQRLTFSHCFAKPVTAGASRSEVDG